MPNPAVHNSYTGKVTTSFIKVLTAFLEQSNNQYSGSDICKMTKLQSGTVYPLLARLKELGWLEAKWEHNDPNADRPPRRFYKITGSGFNHATRFLSENVTPVFATCFTPPTAASL